MYTRITYIWVGRGGDYKSSYNKSYYAESNWRLYALTEGEETIKVGTLLQNLRNLQNFERVASQAWLHW